MKRLPGWAALAAAVVLTLGAPALHAQDRIAVREEPATPVVAAELLLAVGPADEPEMQSGVSYLSARSVTAPLAPQLDSLGAHLELRANVDALAFTLTAAPDVWQDAMRLLLTALFRDPVAEEVVTREQAAVRLERQASEASPADVAAQEADAATFGAAHPWARSPEGSSEALELLTPEDVDAFLRKNFTPDRVTIAVVGPVRAADTRAFLQARLGATPLPAAAPPTPAPADSAVRKEFGSITAWVVATYLFGPSANLDEMRILADIVADRFSFGPSRRAIYDAHGEVTRHAGGGELRFTLVVPPGSAEKWATDLRTAVSDLGSTALPAAVTASWLRRYRGERLLDLATPEARAREMARALMLTGSRLASLAPPAAASAEQLQQAAKSLSAPVMLYLGPEMQPSP